MSFEWLNEQSDALYERMDTALQSQSRVKRVLTMLGYLAISIVVIYGAALALVIGLLYLMVKLAS